MRVLVLHIPLVGVRQMRTPLEITEVTVEVLKGQDVLAWRPDEIEAKIVEVP